MNTVTQEMRASSACSIVDLLDNSIDSALEAAGIGVWRLDFGSGEIHCNSYVPLLLGLNNNALLDLDAVLTDAVFPKDRTGTREALGRALDPSGPGISEVEFRRVDDEGKTYWISATCRAVFSDETGMNSAKHLVCVLRDITEQREALDLQSELIEELNHRGKNMLAMVQSLAYQSFRLDPYASSLYVNFQGRLKALSRTHDLLIEEKFEGVFLKTLLDRIASGSGIAPERLTCQGFPIRLGPRQVVPFGMILHELISNSMKYGSLSVPDGRVTFNWLRNPSSDLVRLVWTELDGPTVVEPKTKGFGIRMIERAAALEFGGLVRFEYAPQGLEAGLTIGLRRLNGEKE